MRFGKWRGVPLAMTLAAILGLGLFELGSGRWLALAPHAARRGSGLRLHDRRRVLRAARSLRTLREGLSCRGPARPSGTSARSAACSITAPAIAGRTAADRATVTVTASGLATVVETATAAASARAAACSVMATAAAASPTAAAWAWDMATATGHGLGLGLGHKKNFAPCHASTVMATSQVQPTSQGVVLPSGQGPCGDPGCKIGGRHSHFGNLMSKIRCQFCGGGGCGGCGGAGLGDPCSGCGGGGSGCGLCGGCGLFHHGHGGTGCGLCGGRGCANCLKGLASKAHGLLGNLDGRSCSTTRSSTTSSGPADRCR